MSPEITAPLFVTPCDVPLAVRLAAIWKILSGRKDLQKSQNFIVLQWLFPYATRRRATTGFPEQVPYASARMARTATRPLRSTPVVTPRRSLLRAVRSDARSQSPVNLSGLRAARHAVLTVPYDGSRHQPWQQDYRQTDQRFLGAIRGSFQ